MFESIDSQQLDETDEFLNESRFGKSEEGTTA
jgi:hypothetical protein